MKEWTKERCSEEPQELQLVADGIYIQRKNIEEVQHEATEGMEAYTDWECDSREITVSEYQMLESIKQINTDKAIDDYLESPKKYEENMEWYRDQISNCTYRQFTTGFFYGKPDHESQIYDSNTYVKEYTYLGIVGEKNEKSRYAIEQRNKFSVGEEIEVMKPDGENVCVTVKGIWDDEGNQMESAPHPKQKLWIDLGVELDRFDILRRKEME